MISRSSKIFLEFFSRLGKYTRHRDARKQPIVDRVDFVVEI